MEKQSKSSQNSGNKTNVLNDIEVLAEFIGVYCQHHHSDQSVHWSSIPELGDIKIKDGIRSAPIAATSLSTPLREGYSVLMNQSLHVRSALLIVIKKNTKKSLKM